MRLCVIGQLVRNRVKTCSAPNCGPAKMHEMNNPQPAVEWTVRYSGDKPPAPLQVWCDAHADRVQEVEVGYGYCSGRADGKAYDILLRPGWRMGDDFVHTIIESTVNKALEQLRNVVQCDCGECLQLIKHSMR